MNALWLLTFFGTMALSLWAAARVKIAYAKGSQVPASSGFTGAEAAARILDAAGIRDVEIVEQDEAQSAAFTRIAEGARDWDGVTDPIRPLFPA